MVMNALKRYRLRKEFFARMAKNFPNTRIAKQFRAALSGNSGEVNVTKSPRRKRSRAKSATMRSNAPH